ncbi:hypothetical protein DSY3294 [Desulfitobacterium hafniense Y51]|uniref:Uncharacterized protein n=1 Tax=Desulfitobacterium hafniense (strain Y51) TaxID=138119 RepID=Q24SA9_DESHY|nr:hypothetical protein DSY3294 [Desulfitobacterium hafniense Y51]
MKGLQHVSRYNESMRVVKPAIAGHIKSSLLSNGKGIMFTFNLSEILTEDQQAQHHHSRSFRRWQNLSELCVRNRGLPQFLHGKIHPPSGSAQ